MKFKKILSSLFLCALLIVSTLPLTAYAATATENNSIISLANKNKSYAFNCQVDSKGHITISSNNDPDYYAVSVAQVQPYVSLCSWEEAPGQETPSFEFNLTSLNGVSFVNEKRYRVWIGAIVNGEKQSQYLHTFTYSD